MNDIIYEAQLLEGKDGLTLQELAHTVGSDEYTVSKLVRYSIIKPCLDDGKGLFFDSQAVMRVKRSLSFQRDLGVNLAGISIILDLLDTIESLKK